MHIHKQCYTVFILLNFLLDFFDGIFWNEEEKSFALDFENEISACVITHGGEVVNEVIKKHYAG